MLASSVRLISQGADPLAKNIKDLEAHMSRLLKIERDCRGWIEGIQKILRRQAGNLCSALARQGQLEAATLICECRHRPQCLEVEQCHPRRRRRQT